MAMTVDTKDPPSIEEETRRAGNPCVFKALAALPSSKTLDNLPERPGRINEEGTNAPHTGSREVGDERPERILVVQAKSANVHAAPSCASSRTYEPAEVSLCGDKLSARLHHAVCLESASKPIDR